MRVMARVVKRFWRWRFIGVLLFVAALAGLSSGAETVAAGPAPEMPKYNGRTVEEWIALLEGEDRSASYQAGEALVKIGEPAVPALLAIAKKGTDRADDAWFALSKIGPAARPALPLLIQLAQTAKWRGPDGTTQTLTPDKRARVLHALRNVTWAAGDLVPVLEEIAASRDAEDNVRSIATYALENMGKAAIPALHKFEDSDDLVVREGARRGLAQVLEKEGIETKAQYYARLVERDMFGPGVPDYLSGITGYVNSGRTHPMREKVKAAYRQRLREKPDPKLAWTLAGIIQDQLRNTEIEWVVPSDWSRGRSAREAPSESFVTLAEVLEVGFGCAEKNSESWRKFGTSLAKLRLLQGDWEGMNATLARMGYTTIPQEDRPWLSAPPEDWKQALRSEWGPADPSMRSGKCGLVVRMEKDGKGLAGFHVVVKEALPPDPRQNSRLSRMIGASLSPQLFGHGAFGYSGSDRPKTRYSVSDASGEVRFANLPKIPIQLEMLIPTANFPEAARDWDLWMETKPGQFQQASMTRSPGTVGPHEPPARVELEEGKTVRYPLLVVRSRLGLNVEDGDRVDKDRFVLSWQGFSPPPGAKVQYELAMSLTRPCWDSMSNDRMPVVRAAKETTGETTWPIGEKGVGGMRLHPGNMYLFEVNARDESGTVLAQWAKTWVWVPWAHRESNPPVGRGASHDMPIGSDLYFQMSRRSNGEEETFPQRTDRWLRENPKAFECEYVRVIQGWLAWHDGKVAEARNQLLDLVKRLPKGSVAQATAVWLIGGIDLGDEPPKWLKFVAFEDLEPNRITVREDGIQW